MYRGSKKAAKSRRMRKIVEVANFFVVANFACKIYENRKPTERGKDNEVAKNRKMRKIIEVVIFC